MSALLSFLAITAIAAVNAVFVAGAGLFGIYGDGSSGAAPMVWGIGWTWTGLFYLAGIFRLLQGRPREGVGLVAKTLPIAIVVVIPAGIAWVVLMSFWKG